jgi:hypothetical protein
MRQLFATILLISSLLAQAQNEFAPIGAEWYYSKYINHNPPTFGYVKHTSLKDSIIENQKVRVIEIMEHQNDTTARLIGHEYFMQKGDTVYYWKNNHFHMLYNFAMQKDDTILLYSEMTNRCMVISESNYGWNKVDSVFTFNANGVILKAYNASGHNNSIWGFENTSLEVIGNLQYLIPQNIDCISDGIGWYGNLRCYIDDSIGYFKYDMQIGCDSTTTWPVSAKLLRNDKLFKCFPNPAYNKVFIELHSQPTIESYNIEILNMLGSKLLEASINDPKAVIDVENLPKGSYLILLKLNHKTIDYEKFIIH